MKYIPLVVLLVGSLLSCTKEEAPTIEEKIIIYGTWESTFDYSNVTDEGQILIPAFNTLDYIYEFNEDGTGVKITHNCGEEMIAYYVWYIEDDLLTVVRDKSAETMILTNEVLILTNTQAGIVTRLVKT